MRPERTWEVGRGIADIWFSALFAEISLLASRKKC